MIVSEADWTVAVIALAQLAGWRTFHARPAWTTQGYRTPVSGDGVGFPDLILVKDTLILAVELKAERGKTTLAQDAWLDALTLAGVTTAVWRPSQIDEVKRTLGIKEA